MPRSSRKISIEKALLHKIEICEGKKRGKEEKFLDETGPINIRPEPHHGTVLGYPRPPTLRATCSGCGSTSTVMPFIPCFGGRLTTYCGPRVPVQVQVDVTHLWQRYGFTFHPMFGCLHAMLCRSLLDWRSTLRAS